MDNNTLTLVKSILPMIGTALGGPLGLGVSTFIASKLGVSPDKVESTLTSMIGNPEDLVKAKQLEYEYKIHCADLGYQSIKDIETLNAASIAAVNVTMQTEAASEHWPTYSWRPYNGFLFGTTIFGCYFVLPLLKIPAPSIPTEIWLAWGSVLGIASFFRGKMQADPTIQTNNKG